MSADLTGTRLALVGTLNFMDAMLDMCKQAGVETFATSIWTYRQGFRWLLSRQFRRATVIYQFGAGGINYILMAKLFRKRLIKHWIGTEVYIITGAKGWLKTLHKKIHLSWPDMHLSVSRHLADILEQNGVRVAGIVRSVTSMLAEGQIEPLPERFAVLGYWPPGRCEFYRGEIVLALAREMPDVKFLIVANDGDGMAAPPNVEFLGWVPDITAVYRRCSALIRMPMSDGACNMPLEMVVRGRYAIYNAPLEGCHYAETIDQARQALLEIRQKTAPNCEGARLVKETYSLAREAAILRKCIEELASTSGRKPGTRPEALNP